MNIMEIVMAMDMNASGAERLTTMRRMCRSTRKLSRLKSKPKLSRWRYRYMSANRKLTSCAVAVAMAAPFARIPK